MEEDVEEYVQVEEAICMDNSTAHRLWLKFSSLASRWPNTLPNIQPDPQASIRRARLLRGRSWETLCGKDYSILVKKLKKEREAAEEADAAVTGWWTKGILFFIILTSWFQLPAPGQVQVLYRWNRTLYAQVPCLTFFHFVSRIFQ